MIGRRGFIAGVVSFVAAPAIVRVGSIMPVKVMPVSVRVVLPPQGWSDITYGRSPAIEALSDMAELERQLIKRMADLSVWRTAYQRDMAEAAPYWLGDR